MAKRKRRSTKRTRKVKSTQALTGRLAKPARVKRHLTYDQEFDIMKLVLDKFLWLGFIIMAVGLYFCLTRTIQEGLYYILAGVVILLLFVWIIVKEFEVIVR